MIRIGALVCAVLFVESAVAYAGSSCGGGGSSGDGGSSGGGSSSGGGGSSSSSSSSDSGYSSSSDSPSHTGCIDDTDVVGYRTCTKFGTWASNMRFPRMFVEIGSNVRQFSSGLGDRTATVAHGDESFAFRTVMPTAEKQTDVAVTSAFRFGIGLPRGLYTGVEFELGGLVSPAAATAEMMTSGTFGSPNIERGGGLVIGAVGLAGLRGTTRRGSFGLEAAGGVRSVSYKFDSSYHHCEDTTTISATRAVVEARARAELWLGPWLTAGATLGSNLLTKHDWMAGVYLGVHSRAFAGGR